MRNYNALVQYGSGLGDIGTIYRGPQFVQRGRGIGSIFAGLWKHLAPLAVSGLKTLGKQSLLTGGNVLRDLTEGKTLKSSLLEHGQGAINNLAQKGVNKLKKMQSGKGILSIKANDPRRNRIVGHLNRYGYKRRTTIQRRPASMKKRGRKKGIRKLTTRKKTTQTGGRRRKRGCSTIRQRKGGCKQSGTGKRKKRVEGNPGGGGGGGATASQTGGRRRRRTRATGSRKKSTRSIDIFDF